MLKHFSKPTKVHVLKPRRLPFRADGFQVADVLGTVIAPSGFRIEGGNVIPLIDMDIHREAVDVVDGDDSGELFTTTGFWIAGAVLLVMGGLAVVSLWRRAKLRANNKTTTTTTLRTWLILRLL
ncbi:hypothetical protein HDU76_007246 [Blyttiomyces sp. JEL0837]|nr:hypothetical protein HDU76_007246 [Blyttiomyces sp. JEL0837]